MPKPLIIKIVVKDAAKVLHLTLYYELPADVACALSTAYSVNPRNPPGPSGVPVEPLHD
jgi:hypothetical protein